MIKPVYFLKSAFIGAIMIAGNADAQMVGDNVFLKGQFVEVGIGKLGYYGSDTAAPTGYHPHGFTRLGFVADPAMDGWATGTPAYMGDYFLPGSPFEGWELEVNGPRCHGFNFGPASTFACYGGGDTASGTNISYATSGSQVIATWQGVVDSVAMTQITTLDTNGLYFTVKVILTNISSAPLNNIYYMRSLDPDNDETWPGGGFITQNKIDYQMPDSMNAVAVSATGISSSAPYLGLGTTDTNARSIIYESWPLPDTISLATVYNETYSAGPAFYAQSFSDTENYATGLIMYVPHLASVDSAGDSVYRTTSAMLHPANSASFTFFYAFSKPALDSAIRANRPAAAALSVNNVNAVADIKVYPNPAQNRVNISGLNSTDQITVFDMMGRAMNENWNVSHQGINTYSMANMAAGAYLIVVTDATGNMRVRVPVRKL